MNIIYKKATLDDLDLLTRTRIEVLRAANKLGSDVDMSIVESGSREYYKRALADGSHTAYLVFDGGVLWGPAPSATTPLCPPTITPPG